MHMQFRGIIKDDKNLLPWKKQIQVSSIVKLDFVAWKLIIKCRSVEKVYIEPS